MTSRQRQELTAEAIQHIFATGSVPTWYEDARYEGNPLINMAVDRLGAVWFRLHLHQKWIAFIDSGRKKVYVREDTVYRSLFEDYASSHEYDVRTLKELNFPGQRSPQWTTYLSFGQRRFGDVDAGLNVDNRRQELVYEEAPQGLWHTLAYTENTIPGYRQLSGDERDE